MNFVDSTKPVFTVDNPPREDVLHAQIAAMDTALNNEQFRTLNLRIKELYELKTWIYPNEILAIAEEIAQLQKVFWKMINIKVESGTKLPTSATVVLKDSTIGNITAKAAGNSSTDAICSAIQQATQIRLFLKDFQFRTISAGPNPLGQARVTIKYHNQQVTAKACSTGLLMATAQAYLTATNIVIDRITQQLD